MRNGNRKKVEELTKQGLSATQIGRRLGISPNTVYAHRNRLRNQRMSKLTKKQERIVKVMEQLPSELAPEEFEALLCSLISGYVGFDETPPFLLYLHLKTASIQKRLVEEAKKETKH
jgi:predicted transcriptional regulator